MFTNYVNRLMLVSAFLAVTAITAQETTRHRAYFSGPEGIKQGTITTSGESLVFVDQSQPQLSFSVSRDAISAITLHRGGTLTLDFVEPRTDEFSPRSEKRLMMTDPASTDAILNWIISSDAERSSQPGAAQNQGEPVQDQPESLQAYDATQGWSASRWNASQRYGGSSAVMFDVRYGDDTDRNGRLIVGQDDIRFVSLEDPAGSKTWNYNQITELQREGSRVVLRDEDGKEFKFAAVGRGLDDRLYQMLADRLVESRANVRISR